MLTKLKKDCKRLLESKEFKKEGFLSGMFLICEIKDIDNTPWQIDFYNKDTDTVTTYLLDKDIEVTDNSKVLKDEKTVIEELDLDEIKMDFKDIEKTLYECLKKHNENPVKITIIILPARMSSSACSNVMNRLQRGDLNGFVCQVHVLPKALNFLRMVVGAEGRRKKT